MKKCIITLVILSLISACKNESKNEVQVQVPLAGITPPDTLKKFSLSLVDNKKDLVCGMPLVYGIGDICHYKGKYYGFCSKECKDTFMKSPEKYFENLKLKK
jgi:YHS domain-containing protein